MESNLTKSRATYITKFLFIERRAQREIASPKGTGIWLEQVLEESKALIPRKRRSWQEMWHYSTSSKSSGM
nr:ADM_HP1_G0005560.mRNA.1.CDS.1 [Saccharomyces cerevisiae]